MKLLVIEKTTRSQLRKSDRPWGGRLSEICQATNRNLIRGVQSRVSVHNIAKPCHSALHVNGELGQRRFQCLPMEISFTCVYNVGASMGATLWMMNEKSADIILVREELGAERCPFKLRDQSSLLS